MAWPIDKPKLDRVRALMKDQDLSALVVRAPDNVLYLTNYWCMKGYDAVVFPREGDPTLIALEPQLADAERIPGQGYPSVQGIRRARSASAAIPGLRCRALQILKTARPHRQGRD